MPDIAAIFNTAMPAILAIIQARHAEVHPDEPALTNAQALAILHDVVLQEVAKDDALAADIRARNPGA